MICPDAWSMSKNSTSLSSLGHGRNQLVDQLVGHCVAVRIGGRNREAHGVAHGRALRHRPGVRVMLRSRGSRCRRGTTPRPAPGSPISHPRSCVVAPCGSVYATLTHRYLPSSAAVPRGYRTLSVTPVVYYVPMEHIANLGVGSLGGVPRPRGAGAWWCRRPGRSG